MSEPVADTERSDEVAALRAELATTRAELDQLLYLTSHDLRAPLRGITHLSEWIQEDVALRVAAEDRAPIDANFKLLKSRVGRLERLVDGMLAYSRAGRGVFDQPADTGASLHRICEEVMRTLGDRLSPVEIARVKLVPGPGADAHLGEEAALRTVLAQLLANAARHGLGEHERVVVTIASKIAGDRFEIAISDDGPGIDPRFHQRVWELFQTLESRDRLEGAGVGLPIVKRLVELRGGAVGIGRAEGGGAALRFTWPGPRAVTSSATSSGT